MYLEHEDDENDEFYLEDLIGFRVRIGTLKGEITDYYDSEANPLFEVEIGGKRILVPAVEEFIAGIDFEGRTVKMVLPGTCGYRTLRRRRFVGSGLPAPTGRA